MKTIHGEIKNKANCEKFDPNMFVEYCKHGSLDGFIETLIINAECRKGD